MKKHNKKVAVGSKNPVKVEAVRLAFVALWPEIDWEVVGVDVTSEVSNQPMSDKESIKGARNRSKKAREAKKAHFGVGLEGGLHETEKMWFDCGWIVVTDDLGREGVGSTMRMMLSNKMMKLIKEGKELGEVNDILFNKKNSKQAEGHFGIMTKNTITRTQGYRDGVISALARFVQEEVFED